MAGHSQDRITLMGVKMAPKLGVSPAEREQPQPCEADVTIWGNFEAAAEADSLASAIDYVAVLKVVVEVAHSREYLLVETLAYSIARGILAACPVQRVAVRLRKEPAELIPQIAGVEVEVQLDGRGLPL